MGSAPPAENTAVFALLATLSDPEKTKAKLNEFEQARITAEQATTAHNKALFELNERMAGFTLDSDRRAAELSKRHSEAEAAYAKLIADAAAHQDAVAKAKTDLEKRERDLAMDTASLRTRQGAADQREHDLTAREAAVAAHEKELDGRHSILDELHEEAMAMKTEAEKRFASLRSLLDPHV